MANEEYAAADELLPSYSRLNQPTFEELQKARTGNGFQHLGNAIGGALGGGAYRDLRGQQVFNQAATGTARLQDILLQANQRRDAEIGRRAAAKAFSDKGDMDSANAVLNAPNASVASEALLHIQHQRNIGDLMTEAQGASPDLNRLNRELMVLHGQPGVLTKVEGQNVLNPMVTPDVQDVAPTDIGEAMIGTQHATAAERNAQAGTANARTAYVQGPQTDLANAHIDQVTSKIGSPDQPAPLKASRLTVPEMTTALGGEPNATGIRHIDPKRLQQFNTLQQGMIEAGDPNAKNSQYVLNQFENSLGNDPTEVPEDTVDVPPELQAGFDYAAKHGGRVPTQPAVQASPKGVATPKNKADYDALPSGTTFIASDGTTRVKP